MGLGRARPARQLIPLAEGPGNEYGDSAPGSSFAVVIGEIRDAFAGAPWPVERAHYVEVRVYRQEHFLAREDGWQYEIFFQVVANFHADKPSKIPSENECVAMLGGYEAIQRHAVDACERGLKKAQKLRKRAENARIACLMVEDYRERVIEATKAATRYEQRLAALEAEYQAEVEVQTAALLAKLGDEPGVVWEDAPGFVPDAASTAAAKAALPEVMSKHVPPHRQGFLSGNDKKAVAMADVAEHEHDD